MDTKVLTLKYLGINDVKIIAMVQVHDSSRQFWKQDGRRHYSDIIQSKKASFFLYFSIKKLSNSGLKFYNG